MDVMNIRPVLNRVSFLSEEKRIGEAEALFAELLNKEPDNCRIFNHLGVIAFIREDASRS